MLSGVSLVVHDVLSLAFSLVFEEYAGATAPSDQLIL